MVLAWPQVVIANMERMEELLWEVEATGLTKRLEGVRKEGKPR